MSPRKTRLIFQALLLSLLLNLTFVFMFFYFALNHSSYRFFWSYKPTHQIEHVQSLNLSKYFSKLELCSYEKLLEALEDKHLVEDGYRVRDLALSVIVSSFQFDILRGLGRPFLQERNVVTENGKSYTLYPGLSQQDYDKLCQFAWQEKFPITSEGLFLRLRQKGITQDPELVHAFIQTPEFNALKILFMRTHLPIKFSKLLVLVLEGEWNILADFARQQKKECDLSDKARQNLLVRYLGCQSKTAASLLLQTDYSYAVKNLSDEDVILLCDQLNKEIQGAEKFCQDIAHSLRSDEIRKKAMKRLSELQGEMEIAGRFAGIGELRPKFREKPPASPSPRIHIVQPGESLWGISKKYNAELEQLMQVNKLQTTIIQPGKTLNIP